MILSHSNHFIQGMEVYRNVPILHSMGDFLTDFSTQTMGWKLTFDKRGVSRVTGYPIETVDTRMDYPSEQISEKILNSFIDQSKKLNSDVHYRLQNNTVVVDIEKERRPPPVKIIGEQRQ